MSVTLPPTAAGPHASPATVTKRLAEALKEADMTQVELARQLAGPEADQTRVESVRRLLIKWLAGRHSPGDAYARNLAQIFGKPGDYFTSSRSAGSTQTPDADSDIALTAIELVKSAVNAAGPVSKEISLDVPFGPGVIAGELAPQFVPEHIVLDEVLTYDPGKSASATASFTAETLKLGQWYKDSKMMPALLILEALAQTASVALLTDPLYRKRIVLCAGYDHVRIKRAVGANETLDLSARLHDFPRGQIAHFDTVARRGEHIVARAMITLAVH